ncbi:hypothetical protein NGM44_08470 [Moraxella sp. FZFQ2102]|uniref:hypothetical protein n=1 Tax=Moraxella sp. FZFQ2102 TaxID=2953752 RepID=UPI00209C0E67|nr:hypothetical protein [Moraxella sp. FZFQ2102]USZ14397.1 hypothetical protein NGM44_08470 [Moraxella sp. FZFQ2102]
MIVLDLPPQTMQIIEQVAQKNGQSVHDFITISAYEKALQSFAEPKDEMLLTDFINTLPNRTHLGDGVAIQKALRDEWD